MADFLFVDETGGKNYSGVCLARVSAHNYAALSKRFTSALSVSGWRLSEEFKGQCVFSSSKGCEDITVDERVSLTKKLFFSTSGQKNAHVTFFYASKREQMTRELYLELLKSCLVKALKRGEVGGSKSLVALYFDQRDDVLTSDITSVVTSVAFERGRLLIEGHVAEVRSNNLSVGVQLADLVGYVCGRYDILSQDVEMISNETQKTGKARQLESSLQLLDIFKSKQVVRVN